MRSLRKFILPALALVVSLFGAWMVSSVMAFLKMPTPLVVLSALLMLPIGLFLWEVYEQRRLGWRYIRKYKIPIILSDIAPKVLILNLSFIVILLLLNASNAFNQPNFVFKALKKNGDWMLANYRGKEVKPLRDALQKTAGNLEKIAGSPAKAKQPVAKAPSAKPSSAPPPESTQPAPSQNDVAEAYYKQGEDALNQCNYDDALANLNKAIELNSGLATAYSNRGFLYYHQGNYQGNCSTGVN